MEPSTIIAVFLAMTASALTVHAVLHKKEKGTAVAWVGLIWLAPVVGSLVYLILGINRIRRKALKARGPRPHLLGADRYPAPVDLADQSLMRLATLVGRVTGASLAGGNAVRPLVDGAEAFGAMEQAFEAATRSITLSTYIFDNDPTGRRFVDHLARARDRGVEVRVLIDAAGVRYSFPTALSLLRSRGIVSAAFLPSRLPARVLAINLRNHRKIAVVDGRLGFCGGMNIREGHRLSEGRHAIRDLHFVLEGPIVAQLQQAFATDWWFCTREVLVGEIWFPPLPAVGGVIARGIPHGPDEDFDKLRLTLLGALSCAERRVVVLTPYFIPDHTLETALIVTAMRGVQVDVLIPEVSNLPIVPWAMWAHLEHLVRHGVRVWLTPPPFDHSKLMIVDQEWSLIGSANWDARSLVLHFEFNVECYDDRLAMDLTRIADAKRAMSRRVTLEELENRSILLKLRDGVADLASPYL